MSRYFKYKRLDAIRAAASALGLDLPFDDDPAPLLRPAAVAGRTLGNRLAIQPMEGCDANLDGTPGELTVRRYVRFGGGGAKLVWGEACAVTPEGRANPRQLVIDERTAPALGAMLAACRAAHRDACGRDDDLLVGLQLTHSGRYCCARPILAQHDPLLDPRTVMDKAAGVRAGPQTPLITDEGLDRLLDLYVVAARRAQALGFDFVDLKQCHRYLLNELLAARTRQGRYGGPFENRTRFIRDLVGRLRQECPGLIVATRLNVFDGIPYHAGADGAGEPDAFTLPVRSTWGADEADPLQPDLREPIALIGMLRDLGLGLLNVTLGNPYASPHLLRPFEYPPPDGYATPENPLIGVARHVRLAAEVQRAFPDLPVVGSGYSWLQAFAPAAGAAQVRLGGITFVGIGRGALAQPDFAARLARGEGLDPKTVCRTFSYCTALMRSKHHPLGQYPSGCPPFDKAGYGEIWKEAREPMPRPAP